jgi:hypothetical protein
VTNAHDAIEATLGELERLRKHIAKGTSRQVSSASDTDLIKANVQTWFRTRRPLVLAAVGELSLREIDTVFKDTLACTHHATTRSRYIDLTKFLKRLLSSLQTEKAIELSDLSQPPIATSDAAPSFAAIAADAEMQKLLTNRWNECVSCVSHDLPLAATVMLGGLIEALLVARINGLTDQSPVHKAAAAPKDRSGKTLVLREWGLSNYIDVANELGWLSDTYKDVGAILRDYRNYIHPYKEYQHKKTISPADAKMLWEIGKNIMHQLLKL